MMKTQEWEMLARYFAGELSPPEQQQVQEWANRHPDHRLAFDQAERLWKEAQDLSLPDADTAHQWESLQKSLVDTPTDAVPTRRLGNRYQTYYWTAAAVVVLLIGIGYAYRPTKPLSAPAAKEIASRSIHVQSTQDSVRVFFLPDSSRVWLNQHSEISYLPEYGQTNRWIRLQGEAYLEVRRDAARPFFVQTDVTLIRVLGTSFNIKAYAAQPAVEVVVVTGKVALYDGIDTLHQNILLKPYEKGTFQRDQGLLAKIKASRIPQRLAWRLLNNPVHQLEMKHPNRFLRMTSKWHKNALNQTVVEGTIRNTASLTSYTEIILGYTVLTRGGREKSKSVILHKVIAPGQTVTYRQNLLGMFSRPSQVSVEVIRAQVNH